MNIFKINILKLPIVFHPFRATCSCYDLQAEGQLFFQICDKQQRRIRSSPRFDILFFLLYSHAPEIKLVEVFCRRHLTLNIQRG